MSVQNILDHNGISIAITGMSIVFIALLFIALFISMLPRILAGLSFILPPEPQANVSAGRSRGEEGEVIAAISMVVHHQEKQKRQRKK